MTTLKEASAVSATAVNLSAPVIAPPNKKQTAKKNSRHQKKKLALRDQLWGKLSEELLWERNSHDGYTTIPRTLPIMFQIMDDLADKGRPISSTYFTLWARVFDESYIEIKSCDDLAFESGFSGQRAVSTWKQRMKKLVELGFIDAKSGGTNEFSYVLIFNPYNVIKKFNELSEVQEGKYNALFARALDVGAGDLT
ncbi:hypothetical protein Q4602_21595 [Paraglaciecola chathamensis]|uniref:hypothetical protein n=1 Tax=Paraglaciecola chathamensis TaxID=368405 RepID=UPI0026FB7F2F|nr:hypothetical protein [Paraglaciecola chathamensis]MDO6842080.1 hypothetical protein [Paraglaciecola chathamensis]